MKLGKLTPRRDTRTLKAHAYTRRSSYPAKRDWLGDLRYPMYDNDQVGDCTCASFGHLVYAQSAAADGIRNATKFRTSSIMAAYSAVSGYDRRTGENDDGAVMLDCLGHFLHTGIAGRRIGAYAAVDFGKLDRLLQAINLFGGVYAGFALPDAAMDIVYESAYLETSLKWPEPPNLRGKWRPNPYNGHAVYIGSYNATEEVVEAPTWGMRATIAFDFMLSYMDECYVIVSESFTNDLGMTPTGVNLRQLMDDRAKVAG